MSSPVPRLVCSQHGSHLRTGWIWFILLIAIFQEPLDHPRNHLSELTPGAWKITRALEEQGHTAQTASHSPPSEWIQWFVPTRLVRMSSVPAVHIDHRRPQSGMGSPSHHGQVPQTGWSSFQADAPVLKLFGSDVIQLTHQPLRSWLKDEA